MTHSYEGNRILVTGGTGSFGHTVAQKLLSRGVDQIRILSRDEAKQDLMRHEIADPRLCFYVGDIRDYQSVERAMRDVDFVFHAAALKQVPSCEFIPMEAAKTNVIGSGNVVRAADQAGVASVVCLSTDKAVYPVNAMGMSRAMMEKVTQSHGLNNPAAVTTVSCVRYGDLMYPPGSVIPLFIPQLKAGRNLTVINPEMTRFMMSLAESGITVSSTITLAVTEAKGQGILKRIFLRSAPWFSRSAVMGWASRHPSQSNKCLNFLAPISSRILPFRACFGSVLRSMIERESWFTPEIFALPPRRGGSRAVVLII